MCRQRSALPLSGPNTPLVLHAMSTETPQFAAIAGNGALKAEIKAQIPRSAPEIIVDAAKRADAIASGIGWKDDQEKFPFHRFPMSFIDWVTDVYRHGAEKYDWDNWKNLDSDRMADAAFRHIRHHLRDRANGVVLPKDKDSGFDALAHVACTSLMALWLAYQEANVDPDEGRA